MVELSFEYWNKLANQLILISTFLGGFSLTMLATFLTIDKSDNVNQHIIRATTVAASCFLVSLFAFTKILMLTTSEFPLPVTQEDLFFPKTLGMCLFLLGIISLLTVLSLIGWTKSRKLGIFSTIVGLLSLALILSFLF